MRWSQDLDQMQWWIRRLRPFNEYCIGSIVPDTFESVGRLFHPIDGNTGPMTWAELAARNGRTAHAEMQLHAISTPQGQLVDESHAWSSWWGDLPAPETMLVQKVVTHHTSTPDRCWFAVWDGYSLLAALMPRQVEHAGSAGTPQRQYHLLEGALTDLPVAADMIGGQTPNLWWPDDRAWFVATDIDLSWTLIGGSARLIEDLVSAHGLEVLRAGFDQLNTVDGDRLNR